jgi:D-serine deaminase-like pyridoxal phosphate-dependent protein
MNKLELDTPALIIDLDALERNIRKMAEFFEPLQAKLRPHAKTHKSPIIAKKQIDAGAIGITCAKLGEAEVMVSNGINDVLIANQIVGKRKIERLVNLAKKAKITVAVDSFENVDEISKFSSKEGVSIGVLIEVNVGMNRCGVEHGLPALKLANHILRKNGVEFKGLMGYEGHAVMVENFQERRSIVERAMKLLMSTKDLLENEGIKVEVVSAGGTGTYNITGKYQGVTEVQAGSYIFMDTAYKRIIKEFENSLTVLASVISRPKEDRLIVDVGLKAMPKEEQRGIMPEPKLEGLKIYALAEEHGYVKVSKQVRDIKVGDKIEFIVAHCCTTVNLHDCYHVIKDDKLLETWKIEARGKFT